MTATSLFIPPDIPVLCIDTCSVLDIMRDPTRDSIKSHDMRAAVDIIEAAEAGKVTCLIAEQVAIEFSGHDLGVQEEAVRNLKKLCDQLKKINDIAAIYGSVAPVNLSHLDDHVTKSRAIVERLLQKQEEVIPSPSIPGKAFLRVNANLAPAKRGKESSKDCLIYETYLEVISDLRTTGLTAPVVFLSSNTHDYMTEGKVLKSEISADFMRLNISYASSMGMAKNILGL